MVAIEQAGEAGIGLAQLEPSDREALGRLFHRLSPETLYRRFMSPISRPDQIPAGRLLDVDHQDREAIVAVEDGEILGVARYYRTPGSDQAELAVVVADAWQRRGLATRMLAALARHASAAGIQRFALVMQADNRPILSLVRRAAPAARFAVSGALCETSVPVAAWSAASPASHESTPAA